jgi:hypothetical protein
MRKQLPSVILIFVCLGKLGPELRDGRLSSIFCCCNACNTHALPIPFVADQTSTSVSAVHDFSRLASQNPP